MNASGRLAAFFADLRRRVADEAADDLEPEAKPESAEYTAWNTRRRIRDEEADRLKRRLASLEAEATADVRPKAAVDDPDRIAWYARHLNRQRRRLEIDEGQALTTEHTDPAPFAEEGFDTFMAWAKRQTDRRRVRGAA